MYPYIICEMSALCLTDLPYKCRSCRSHAVETVSQSRSVETVSLKSYFQSTVLIGCSDSHKSILILARVKVVTGDIAQTDASEFSQKPGVPYQV